MFRKLDYPLWRQTAHNPVLMLQHVSQEMLNLAAKDERYLLVYDAAVDALDAARSARDTWWQHRYPDATRADRVLLRRVRAAPVAADLRGRPRRARRRSLQGGERSRDSADRRRVHVSAGLLPPDRFARKAGSRKSTKSCRGNTRPSSRATTPEGKPCIVAVPLGNRSVLVSVWRVRLGRVKLYLLDTDLEENAPGIANCRPGCTAAIARRASSRKSFSGSAACARSKP